MTNKKELKEQYKLHKPKMGVYQIRNLQNQKIFIEGNTDLNAIWNRSKFSLKHGSHRNLALQADWNAIGEDNFVFEIIGEIAYDELITDYKREVKKLESMFMEELQPFGEKGYHEQP